jgi:integrase/recombinase XerD
MSETPQPGPAAARYDTSRCYARNYRLPPDYPTPQPTTAWPAENVALLEHYREWLLSGGISSHVVNMLYIPMAGNALGLNLDPHPQLDLDADLERALDYVKAKRLRAQWIKMCRNALDKFRLFLRQQRGQIEIVIKPLNRERYCVGLPDWLVAQLERYQHLMQRNWRPARLNEQILRFWGGQTRFWRWLFKNHEIDTLANVKRQHVLDYIDHRLAAGYAASTVNQDLRALHAFLRYLQEQDYPVPLALLRIPGLKQPDRLPRFLTDEQVRRLRDVIEERLAQAHSASKRRDALLDRAAFYLLWQGGLRLGEVEELRLEDLDTSTSLSTGLAGRKLTVRQGKGRTDRTVYLTDTVVQALQDYLAVRGMGPSDHVFLYRNRPLCKDLVRARIKAAGKQAGVKVTPHRLRHTFGTQLLNAGCRVTTIQKLLGHRRLNSTMIYARVHDRTVAEDYYAAMAKIEKRLELAAGTDSPDELVNVNERTQLLALVDLLAKPELDRQARLELAAQMRRVASRSAGAGRGPDEWEGSPNAGCPGLRRAVVIEYLCRGGG